IDELKNDVDELKNDLYEANVYRHSYKLKIDQLEDRLAEYKEREVKYIETIRSLERDKECNLRKINKLTSDVETLQEEKDVVDGKLARLLKSSKDLKDIIESQRSEKVKEGLGYNAVSPPANLYLSPKKDLSWTGFVKAAERPTTDKAKTAKKPAVRYAEMYRRTSKRRAPRSKINSARPNKPAHSYGRRRSFQETTQDLMIILIQRVQRLEKELKSRTPIHKVDRGRYMHVMAWVPKND
nr:hypothetical protein [Tanacetum cinerariifolium]